MTMRSIICGCVILLTVIGCQKKKPEYGVEQRLALPGSVRQTWAVAPVLNVSGQREVDPILQADLIYGQLQQVAGLNVLPVNRVVDVFNSLRIAQVQSQEQANLVCQYLGCDALVVGTVTAYDPFDPPKMGASLALFRRSGAVAGTRVDPTVLARQAAPPADVPMTVGDFVQVVGMFDASNGSTRAELLDYAKGRNDPSGPFRERGYLVEMDRFAGFVYHNLIAELLDKPGIGAQ